MENLDNAIYETNMTKLMANFWMELCRMDDNENCDDADVLARLTCQIETIKAITNYGNKLN